MGGRKRRADDAEAGPSTSALPAAQAQEPRDPAAAADPQQQALSRREQQRDIARRRAAHFAHYEAGGQGPSGVHAGAEEANARSLGPWSSAVALADAREEELQRRENKIMEAARGGVGGLNGSSSKAAPDWTPSRDLTLGPRHQCCIPPLAQLALTLVADVVAGDLVETLWGLPDQAKAQVAAELARRRAFTPEVSRLFVEHSPTEVILADCSSLDPEALQAAILEAATPKLELLDLGMCGRGMTDAVAEAIASGGVLSSLQTLRLTGAYRLSDKGVAALLSRAPALSALALPQCPRLQGPAFERLPDAAPHLRRLDLSECRGVGCDAIAAASRGLPFLQALSLDGISEVDDALLGVLGEALKGLTDVSIRSCPAVTNEGVAVLAAALPGLRRVVLDECGVGGEAVLALARHCPSLEELSLRRCVRVEDTAVAAAAPALRVLRKVVLAGVVRVGDAAVTALGDSAKETLEEVDLSWCRRVSPAALGRLADTCRRLRKVALWGCTQVGDTFLLGHSNNGLEVVGRGESLLPVVL